MLDVREVAARTRGKATWSVNEINQAFPSMSKRIIDGRLRDRYGRSADRPNGVSGWHGGGDMRTAHYFVRGWALCGWGSMSVAFGRDVDSECPTCRNEVERSKVA